MIDEFFIHTVTVDTYQGTGAYGDTYAPTSGPVPCYLDETRRLARDANGTEAVSEATLFTTLADGGQFPTGSVVHLDGRDATVMGRARRDGDALGLPSHTEVTLT